MHSSSCLDISDSAGTSDSDMSYSRRYKMRKRRMITNPEQASLDFGSLHQYRIRRSKRAKHLRINIHPQSGVEVVLPHRMSERHIRPFVEQHSEWINRQVRHLGLDQPVTLPDSIHLAMTDELWQVSYESSQNSSHHLKEQHRHLVISGPNHELDPCRDQLLRWIRKQARHFLPERLAYLSDLTGLRYSRVSIRTQKTRWGSCSARGNINLNDRLILLPPQLADYVMVHELCHTRVLNHSPAFWALVEQHCPDYKIQQRELRRARLLLPDWV
jgi:predicted metal-dependent hydrolase